MPGIPDTNSYQCTSVMFRIIHLKLDPREMRGRLDKRDNFDDKPEAAEKRIETFQEKTVQVLEKYKYKASVVRIFFILFSSKCSNTHRNAHRNVFTLDVGGTFFLNFKI